MLACIKKIVNIVMQEAKESKSTSVKCNHCRLMLPLEEYPNRKKGTGKTLTCTKCVEETVKKGKERQLRTAEEIKKYQLERYPNGLYKCLVCQKEKPFVAFYSLKSNKLGIIGSSCKECTADKLKKKKILVNETDLIKCITCEQVKPAAEFRNNPARIDSRCRACHAQKRKAYRANLKAERYRLKSEGCAQCGFENVLAMQFAHYKRETKHRSRNGKLITPSILCPRLLKKELPFMRVLCANCHRLETCNEYQSNYSQKPNAIQMRKGTKAFKQIVINEKLKRGKCLQCEKKVREDICCMFDFDHRNPKEKLSDISAMQSYGYTFKEIQDEMEKCDLLCANCHQIKTQIIVQKLDPALQVQVNNTGLNLPTMIIEAHLQLFGGLQ